MKTHTKIWHSLAQFGTIWQSLAQWNGYQTLPILPESRQLWDIYHIPLAPFRPLFGISSKRAEAHRIPYKEFQAAKSTFSEAGPKKKRSQSKGFRNPLEEKAIK